MALINETNRDRLLVQRDAIERIETKGTILMGFALVALQFVFTLDHFDLWLYAALGAYLVALGAGVVVIVPYRHDYPPDPVAMFDLYASRSVEDALEALAATRAAAFGFNVPRARKKAVAWWVSLAALIGAILLTGISLVRG